MATSAAYDQAVRELSGEAAKFAYRWRMRWWRVMTWLRVQSPAFRACWRDRFATEPCLHNARTHGGAEMFETMAGFYNDSVVGGNMTAAHVRRIVGF